MGRRKKHPAASGKPQRRGEERPAGGRPAPAAPSPPPSVGRPAGPSKALLAAAVAAEAAWIGVLLLLALAG
jgi:hypothetical protein